MALFNSNNASSRRPISRSVGNASIVWMCSSVQDCQQLITELQTIVNSVKLFSLADECVGFITETKDQKLFLIIFGCYDEILISSIHHLTQLDSIYIFSDESIGNSDWPTRWMKFKGIFTDICSLQNQLKRNIRQMERSLTPISCIPASSSPNLDELQPSFMYSQMLKEVLLNMEHDEKTKTTLIEYCRVQYAGNHVQLSIINQFECDYNKHTPI
ncbi:unnamed protein product [Adineta ricciae]|uniref:Uncharacterized protein n=1 Tax=Adineta ricciae TaxID=249248 RepID=A0A814BJZ0_ADIRI|nr:unnamed protein product [Adineta ricciae]CAF1282992.1 unnamed protein product [Adineta ricciae]